MSRKQQCHETILNDPMLIGYNKRISYNLSIAKIKTLYLGGEVSDTPFKIVYDDVTTEIINETQRNTAIKRC